MSYGPQSPAIVSARDAARAAALRDGGVVAAAKTAARRGELAELEAISAAAPENVDALKLSIKANPRRAEKARAVARSAAAAQRARRAIDLRRRGGPPFVHTWATPAPGPSAGGETVVSIATVEDAAGASALAIRVTPVAGPPFMLYPESGLPIERQRNIAETALAVASTSGQANSPEQLMSMIQGMLDLAEAESTETGTTETGTTETGSYYDSDLESVSELFETAAVGLVPAPAEPPGGVPVVAAGTPAPPPEAGAAVPTPPEAGAAVPTPPTSALPTPPTSALPTPVPTPPTSALPPASVSVAAASPSSPLKRLVYAGKLPDDVSAGAALLLKHDASELLGDADSIIGRAIALGTITDADFESYERLIDEFRKDPVLKKDKRLAKPSQTEYHAILAALRVIVPQPQAQLVGSGLVAKPAAKPVVNVTKKQAGTGVGGRIPIGHFFIDEQALRGGNLQLRYSNGGKRVSGIPDQPVSPGFAKIFLQKHVRPGPRSGIALTASELDAWQTMLRLAGPRGYTLDPIRARLLAAEQKRLSAPRPRAAEMADRLRVLLGSRAARNDSPELLAEARLLAEGLVAAGAMTRSDAAALGLAD